MKKALITGITGQDGSYLSELLLEKGYDVYGVIRRSSVDKHKERIQHLEGKENFHLVSGDLLDLGSVTQLIDTIQPDEIYNLAAQSHVGTSFKQPVLTENINYYGLKNIVEHVYNHHPKTKIYQASTSELFGNSPAPQWETTEFDPCSPYAEAKLKAHMLMHEYRAKGLFACCGILFNHESPRRGVNFVTRKICKKVAEISRREDNILVLGNMESKRDWGYAGDYVEAMYLMMQHDKPDDFVVATGRAHSIREFVDKAFELVQDTYVYFDLSDMSEKDADEKIRMLRVDKDVNYVVSHPKFFRPADVNHLEGDCSKARAQLKWKPKHGFEKLVRMMLEAEL